MTRDEFIEQMQELITQAHEERLPMIDLWSALAEQYKFAEVLLDLEIVTCYKKSMDEV